jgi:hypothetical protein
MFSLSLWTLLASVGWRAEAGDELLDESLERGVPCGGEGAPGERAGLCRVLCRLAAERVRPEGFSHLVSVQFRVGQPEWLEDTLGIGDMGLGLCDLLGCQVKVTQVVQHRGDEGQVEVGVGLGQTAVDGERLAVVSLGLLEALGVAVKNRAVVERRGDSGEVSIWVGLGELAPDGKRLAVALLSLLHALGVAVQDREIVERHGDVGAVGVRVGLGEPAINGERLAATAFQQALRILAAQGAQHQRKETTILLKTQSLPEDLLATLKTGIPPKLDFFFNRLLVQEENTSAYKEHDLVFKKQFLADFAQLMSSRVGCSTRKPWMRGSPAESKK